jgi:glycosyltransferase involved in cell wall biosynthesis
MSRPLKHLLLATAEDPFDPKSWSGTPFALRAALERKVGRVSVFRPGSPSRNLPDVVRRIYYGGAQYPLWVTKATLKKNGRELRAEIARSNPDAVLAISSMCLAELGEVSKPVFMFSDAPYIAYHEAYRGTIDRPRRLDWFGDEEAKVARRIDGLCFASSWAVQEAVNLYGPIGRGGTSMESRLHVTPLGAILTPKLGREAVLERVAQRPTDRIELLFVGKDWERKGGPMALEVARLLRAAGHAVKLHLVGCRPELPADSAEYVTLHGVLHQDQPEEAAKLSELFLNSHFLIVPTMAECFGIVFAEAQAFALPPVSRAVQALPGVVSDGVTGLLLDPDASAAAYVEGILARLANPEAYRAMAVAARDRYETLLNWDATAEKLVTLMEQQVVARAGQP